MRGFVTHYLICCSMGLCQLWICCIWPFRPFQFPIVGPLSCHRAYTALSRRTVAGRNRRSCTRCGCADLASGRQLAFCRTAAGPCCSVLLRAADPSLCAVLRFASACRRGRCIVEVLITPHGLGIDVRGFRHWCDFRRLRILALSLFFHSQIAFGRTR